MTLLNARPAEWHNPRMVRSKVETCERDGVAYRVETTWDDETGISDIREFAPDGSLARRCDWRIWPDVNRRGDQIGEAVWFDASGAELERRPLRLSVDRSRSDHRDAGASRCAARDTPDDSRSSRSLHR